IDRRAIPAGEIVHTPGWPQALQNCMKPRGLRILERQVIRRRTPDRETIAIQRNRGPEPAFRPHLDVVAHDRLLTASARGPEAGPGQAAAELASPSDTPNTPVKEVSSPPHSIIEASSSQSWSRLFPSKLARTEQSGWSPPRRGPRHVRRLHARLRP